MATLSVNRPPAITWHWLRINEATLELPEGHSSVEDADSSLSISLPENVEAYVAAPSALGETPLQGDPARTDAFDAALRAAGGDLVWETGLGEEGRAWLRAAAVRRVVLVVGEGVRAASPVEVSVRATDGAIAVVALDVVARAGSSVELAVHFDSPEPGAGLVGSLTRVFAERGARVSLESFQTLDDTWVHLEDTGIYQLESSRVDVSHTLLGGKEAYLGFGCQLAGEEAHCEVDTRYLGDKARVVDFNYVLRHRAERSTCNLQANGVLVEEAQKTLRGTIDLLHGCKGSVGAENETVLLASPKARNKTLPVILCTEDDVQGAHGATIGHVNPEHMEYLASRGLTDEQAEALFVGAVYEYAYQNGRDEARKRGVARLAAASPVRIAFDGEEE